LLHDHKLLSYGVIPKHTQAKRLINPEQQMTCNPEHK